MKHLGISGGGIKISGLFGAAEAIIAEKQYQPDITSGISAGAFYPFLWQWVSSTP